MKLMLVLDMMFLGVILKHGLTHQKLIHIKQFI